IADLNLSTIPTSWHIQAIGDFNGDGHSDIVWRNNDGSTQLWEMDGGAKIADLKLELASLGPVPGDWHIIGSGDFHGDGKTDILWRDSGSGQTVLWEMNGNSKLADVNLNSIPNDWTLFNHHYDMV